MKMHPAVKYYLPMIVFVVLLVIQLIALAVKAWSYNNPQEPDVEMIEYWLPTPTSVEIYYSIDGLIIGYMHAQESYPEPTKEYEAGTHFQRGDQLFLVTGDSEQPVLYIVASEADMIKTPFYPTWQNFIIKTFNHECGCPIR